MARSILARRKTGKQPHAALSFQAQSTIQSAHARLQRAQDILNALIYCDDQGAELSLAALAASARDSIDRAMDGLSTLSPKGNRDPDG